MKGRCKMRIIPELVSGSSTLVVIESKTANGGAWKMLISISMTNCDEFPVPLAAFSGSFLDKCPARKLRGLEGLTTSCNHLFNLRGIKFPQRIFGYPHGVAVIRV